MSKRYKVLSVVGTRPNFMKVAPIAKLLKDHPTIDHMLLHTGQHFNTNMSNVFFEDLELGAPDINLGVSGGTIGGQTGRIMVEFEKALLSIKPDMVLVVGDVNSTLACALVAAQNHVPVAHVEAGLRSFDRTMPEEVNRICTDHLSDLNFTTHYLGDVNLQREGLPSNRVHWVGDVMIDSVGANLMKISDRILSDLKLTPGQYGVVTLHRPSNVNNCAQLDQLMAILQDVSKDLPLVFPVHPRTKHNLQQFYFNEWPSRECSPNLQIIDPLSYLDFLSLMVNSKLIITDSGSIQSESTYLNIPCVVVRDTTERPFCVEEGTTYLAGTQYDSITETISQALKGSPKISKVPPRWDGRTAERIVSTIEAFFRAKAA